MKPVIKKQTHYSVLLMRDDTQARTFRVSNAKLRFFLTFFLLLLVFGAAGTAGGVHYWKKYRTLQGRFETQERDTAEMRIQLERLKNLESLLAASGSSMPQARNEEIGVHAGPSWSQGVTNGNGFRPSSNTDNGRGNSVPGTPVGIAPSTAIDSGTAVTPAPGPGQDTGREPTPPTSNGTAAVAQSGGSPALSAENGLPVTAEQAASAGQGGLLSIDSSQSPLRIANFNARVTGQQRIRVAYELSTATEDGNKVISGKVAYSAIMEDGKIVELSSLDSGGARFAITRMKLMQTTMRVPQGYKATDVKTLEVIVELNDGPRFEESFGME